MGARWGGTALPLRWRGLLHGWPGYRARDLLRLAVLAARKGEPDPIGWPSAPDLLPQYRETYRLEPVAEPLPDDPGLVVGNAAGLETGEWDVVVSLCRMGSRPPPGAGLHHEVALVDSPDPADNPNLAFLLEDLVEAISAWRDEDRTLLLHCVAAESRTPTVAARYLARRLGIGGAEALARVRETLPGARPNPLFRRILEGSP